MPETNQCDRVWEIIEKVGVCMLTTSFEGGLRARFGKPEEPASPPALVCCNCRCVG